MRAYVALCLPVVGCAHHVALPEVAVREAYAPVLAQLETEVVRDPSGSAAIRLAAVVEGMARQGLLQPDDPDLAAARGGLDLCVDSEESAFEAALCAGARARLRGALGEEDAHIQGDLLRALTVAGDLFSLAPLLRTLSVESGAVVCRESWLSVPPEGRPYARARCQEAGVDMGPPPVSVTGDIAAAGPHPVDWADPGKLDLLYSRQEVQGAWTVEGVCEGGVELRLVEAGRDDQLHRLARGGLWAIEPGPQAWIEALGPASQVLDRVPLKGGPGGVIRASCEGLEVPSEPEHPDR